MTEPNVQRAQEAIKVIRNPETNEAQKKAAWDTLWEEQQKVKPASGSEQYDGKARNT